jgi:hypothetical protein
MSASCDQSRAPDTMNLVQTGGPIDSEAPLHLLWRATCRVAPNDVVGYQGFWARPILGHHSLVQCGQFQRCTAEVATMALPR